MSPLYFSPPGNVETFSTFGVILLLNYKENLEKKENNPPEKLEKVQGATRLGATRLRASERKSASERVSERTSENLSKISENLSKNSENL